jgi:hypothetical protein
MSSALKSLYSDMIKSGGTASLKTSGLKLYVKESFPHFLVTDGFFYVSAYFTKKAVDEFHSKFSNLNITDLRTKVIHITDWTLEMNRVNSTNVFTSYGGIECRLIVKSFKPVAQDSDSQLNKYPVNLYRDDEMKTLIQNYIHSCVLNSVTNGIKESVTDVSKLSGKGNVNQGVVSFASGASFNGYTFKDGKNVTVDLNTIFKQEKGADALKKIQAGPGTSGKAKVTGGARGAAAKVARKSGKVAGIVEKISKLTPGGKNTAAKKSTARILTRVPTLQSPGGDKEAGTTDNATMKDFQKMISYLKKGKTSGKRSGKVSGGSKISGKRQK